MYNKFRKQQAQSFREIIKEVLQDFEIDTTLKEKDLIKAWPQVTGPMFTRYTSNLEVRNRILFVTLKSSIVRNELMMAKVQLIHALNNHMKEEVIRDIIFR